MLNYVASQGVIYFAFNSRIGTCEDRHASIGTKICPKCGKPIIHTWSRVVGFYTNSDTYSAIRRKEFDRRKWYNSSLKEGMM